MPRTVPPAPTASLSFPNARQGIEYRHEILLPREDLFLVSGNCQPPDSGLTVDAASRCVIGVPRSSGDVVVDLTVQDGTKAESRLRGTLYVNADPRSLWKDIPSDQAEPFWKPDRAHQEIASAGARLLAGRCRGRSHAHAGTCCDDDFFLSAVGEWHVAVVADGAGSAAFSRLGSQVAVRTAGTFLADSLPQEPGQELSCAAQALALRPDGPAELRAVRDALWVTVGAAAHAAVAALIETTKTHEGIAWKDLSTTLLIGVTRKVGERWFCAGYWVGDGALAAWSASTGKVTLLGDADAGEYSGQTRFLGPEEVDAASLSRRLRHCLCDSLDALVLMTDGVSDPWFESEASLADPHAWTRFWDEISPRLEAGEDGMPGAGRLEAWLDFWSAGNHDDRALALVLPGTMESRP